MTVEKALEIITKELKNNPKYYRVWKEKMTQAFKEEYAFHAINEPSGFIFCPTTEDINNISSMASDNFLTTFINQI